MSDLDKTTELWVLRAKVDLLSKSNAALISGVRGMALTLRKWAVAAGGHTPSAIVASRLLELIGDEKAPNTDGESVEVEVTAETITDEQIRDLLALVSAGNTVEMHRGHRVDAICREALGEVHLHGSSTQAARRHCAEILNARAKESK